MDKGTCCLCNEVGLVLSVHAHIYVSSCFTHVFRTSKFHSAAYVLSDRLHEQLELTVTYSYALQDVDTSIEINW